MGPNLPLIPLEGGGFHVGEESFKNLHAGPLAWMDKPFWMAIISAIVVIALWVLASRKLKLVPSKGQFLAEYFYDFIRNGVARDMIGPDFRKFVPYLVALFSFILLNNWFGELFVFMFPTFSKIGYAYGLAVMTWFLYIGAGIRKHGFAKFMRLNLLPEGVPVYLWWLIIPLEFLSNFITRPITLALRLFANLFAGHLVIMVFVVGGAFLLTYPHNVMYNVAGGVSILFSFAVFALELFVGALQAYIFTVLTAQYVSTSIADSH